MFTKRPSELTPEDIRRVVNEKVPEGSELEFKEGLSTKDGQPHPWTTGTDRVGERARNELLAEVVAFANTYGGWLVVGIRETEEKPARAAEVLPIRACAELAERLRLMCRDCIEPRLPVLDVEGVPMRDDGAGVVVFHVPRSRMAPHRHEPTRECYRRHADRTERMTMREIQDLTLQVERGMVVIDSHFKEWQERFAETWARFSGQAQEAIGMRIALVPLTPVYIERVHENGAVKPLGQTFAVRSAGERPFTISADLAGGIWRPVLRGTKSEAGHDRYYEKREVICDGIIEYATMERDREPGVWFRPSIVMALVANGLIAAERFRRAAGAPDIEYGMELELRTHAEHGVPVTTYGRDGFLRQLGVIPAPGRVIFPRYVVSTREGFGNVWSLAERDFFSTAGFDWGGQNGQGMLLDFENAFQEVGL